MNAVVEDDEEKKVEKPESRMCRRLNRPVMTWLFLLAKRSSCFKGVGMKWNASYANFPRILSFRTSAERTQKARSKHVRLHSMRARVEHTGALLWHVFVVATCLDCTSAPAVRVVLII